MTARIHIQRQCGLLGILLLVGLQGCAASPQIPSTQLAPSPLPVGTIGVVVTFTGEREKLDMPSTGWTANLGRGAAQWGTKGATLGAGIGILCWQYFLMCSPPLAVAIGVPGAAAGAIYGVTMGESALNWQNVRSTVEPVLTREVLEEALLQQSITYARDNGYTIDRHAGDAPTITHDPAVKSSSSPHAVETLLEIRDPQVHLTPTTDDINPPRRMVVTAQFRVIRLADQKVLGEQLVTDDSGAIRSLAEWQAVDATGFRDEVRQALHRLAVTIIEQAIMLIPVPEHPFSINWAYNGVFRGVGAVDPPMAVYVDGPAYINHFTPTVSSLQPTLRWQIFQGNAVTYELMIWRAADYSRTCEHLGDPVYHLNGLTKSSQLVAIPLDPTTKYCWTVRAWFVDHGMTKVTPWSTRSTALRMSLFGLEGLNMPSGYYAFYTP